MIEQYSGATETQKHVASCNMPHYTITYAVINACTLAIPASITDSGCNAHCTMPYLKHPLLFFDPQYGMLCTMPYLLACIDGYSCSLYY